MHASKKLLSQLNGTLRDFIFGNDTKADAFENETLELRTSGLVDKFGISAVGGNGSSHDQNIERDLVGKIRKEIDSPVIGSTTRF